MATDHPLQPQIEQALQRFDIADFDALTEWTKKYMNEHMKDLLLAALGRVFYGFKIVNGAGALDIKISGEALAVNAAGELLVRKSTDSDSTLTLPGVAGNYYVSVILQTPDASAANRKKWDTGAEVTVNVNTMRKHVADFINPPPTAGGALDMANFAATYIDGDGAQRTTLPLAIVVNDGASVTAIHDCRRMFAVNGNVNGSVTGLATEFPHDFAPSDAKTLGITSIRDHLRALADRIKAISGEAQWYTSPGTALASAVSSIAAIVAALTASIAPAYGTSEARTRTIPATQFRETNAGTPIASYVPSSTEASHHTFASAYSLEAYVDLPHGSVLTDLTLFVDVATAPQIAVVYAQKMKHDIYDPPVSMFSGASKNYTLPVGTGQAITETLDASAGARTIDTDDVDEPDTVKVIIVMPGTTTVKFYGMKIKYTAIRVRG